MIGRLAPATVRSIPWLLAVLYAIQRLWIVLTGRCLLDSDEAIIGIMSLEILRGDVRVFFHGQDYMGPFQSWASIPFFIVSGANPLSLRLVAIAEGITVVFLWRAILRRWNAERVWPFFALLLAIAPAFMTIWTLKSHGGYIEILLLGSLWFVLFSAIMDSPKSFEALRTRWFLLGCLTGVAWWTSQLILFFLAPAAVLLFVQRGNAKRMGLRNPEGPGQGPSPARRIVNGAVVLAVFYALSLALLIARGSVDDRSALSGRLFQFRYAILASPVIVAALFLMKRNAWKLASWPYGFGLGAVLGYAPALTVILSKEQLYNTPTSGSSISIGLRIAEFAFSVSGGLIGVADESFETIGLPLAALVFVPGLYVLALAMLLADVARKFRARAEASPIELLLAVAIPLNVLLLVAVTTLSKTPRFALFLMFYLQLALGWFFSKLWEVNKAVTVLTLLALLSVHLYSAAHPSPVPVAKRTMIPPEDQELVDFLVGQGVHTAATSFRSAQNGYWDAYRLSFFSRERLTVHPVFHTPRVARYREALRRAERCAIITRLPGPIAREFEQRGIPYRTEVFGSQTVFWDFDKGRVDELGLIDYRDSLESDGS